MNSTRITILKNAFSLFGAQLITWSVTLLVTVIVPRYLGPTLSGQLIIGYAIWAVVVLMTEFGMDTAIVKEVARTPDITPNVLGTTLVLRLIFFVIGCGLVAIYTSIVGYSAEVIEIIFLIGIAQLFLLLGGACRSVLEGIESMQSIALVDIITKAIHMVLAIAAVLLGYGLRTFVLVAIIVALAYLITMLLAVLRRFPLMFQTNMASAVGLLQQSVPYLFSKAAIGL
jgi:O-antigen/teichoic acid export membrane protein